MVNKNYRDILEKLPYKSSFLFVDNISLLNEEEVIGDYTLKKDAFFYEDHFPGHPVTPGCIIIEIMAQIGLVVLGIYLLSQTPGKWDNKVSGSFPLFTSANLTFSKMVLPGEKVTVISRKQYFRFGKLKCSVEMRNGLGETIAKGIFSGLITPSPPIK